MSGVRVEEFLAPRFVHVLCELFIQDGLHEEEVAKHIASERGKIIAQFEGRAYNDFQYDYDSPEEEYGMSNDNISATSDEPLPYIAPTEPTESGYPGLDPPMG